MAEHHRIRAEEIVNQFRELVGADQARQIPEDHLAELALLIESAIDTAVLERMEAAAAQLRSLAEQLAYDSEHYSGE